MNTYTPFDKTLREITAADLKTLRQVSEGWYVEYKREVPNASSIAKSISAFGNTHGGWLFYGVDEKSKTDPVAGGFPGIERSEIDLCRQRIRQAVAANVMPSPHFDMEIIWGPYNEIGLLQDRAVICIHVPRSIVTPHVHKSGLIYRRVADGAEPRPESDRFVLDQLWRRADDFRNGYRKWLKRDPELSKAERETPYLRLLLVPDLWGAHDIQVNLTVKELREIMTRSEKLGIEVPFETVFTCSHGFVARQASGGPPNNLGLTWRLWPDLASEILLPFNKFEISNPMDAQIELDGFSNAGRFSQVIKDHRYENIKILELNFLFSLLVGVVRIQQRLCDKANWIGPWYAKGRLLNVWRASPFIDIGAIIDGFQTHGIPMCLSNKVTVPPGFDPETFYEIESFSDIELPETRILAKAYSIFSLIAGAFGSAWMA